MRPRARDFKNATAFLDGRAGLLERACAEVRTDPDAPPSLTHYGWACVQACRTRLRGYFGLNPVMPGFMRFELPHGQG